MQGGLYFLLSWQSTILFPLIFSPNAHISSSASTVHRRLLSAVNRVGPTPKVWTTQGTLLMLIGMPFAFMAGWALVWLRLYYTKKVAERFKAAKNAGVLRIRHHFIDAQEVEVVARWVSRCSLTSDGCLRYHNALLKGRNHGMVLTKMYSNGTYQGQ